MFDWVVSIVVFCFVGSELVVGWVGFYENIFDYNVMIGCFDIMDGVIYVIGFFGYGFL